VNRSKRKRFGNPCHWLTHLSKYTFVSQPVQKKELTIGIPIKKSCLMTDNAKVTIHYKGNY